jgi:lysophospholipase L1-like esterase
VNIPDRDPVLKVGAEIFNGAIEAAVKEKGEGYFIADLFRSRLNNDFYYMNTLDGLHPDEDGMRYIAELIIGAIKENI